jgi:hypothetical protein
MPIPAYRSITLDNSASTLLNLFTAFFAFMLLASGARVTIRDETFHAGGRTQGQWLFRDALLLGVDSFAAVEWHRVFTRM